MSKLRITLAVAGVLAAVLALSACSSATSSTAPSAGATQFNTADVSFATDMSAHHQQAIEMSQMVLDKSGIDPRVTTLAQDIKAAQSPEIKEMKTWLKTWGQKPDGMSGMDMSGSLMSDADMNELKSSTGLTASKLFLTQMTTHHTSAIAMAKTEITKGKNADAIALARKIITAQTAEITKMSSILATL